MKIYNFRVIVTEGNDEFWKDFAKREVSGIEELKEMLKESLDNIGLDENYVDIQLVEFTDK